MKASRWLLPLVVLLVVCGALLLAGSRNRSVFHARARFVLDTGDKGFALTSFQEQVTVISNFLSTPACRSTLARVSGLEETHFELERIGPVRSTELVYIDYSGPQSDCVRSLASNAAALVVCFYATNQPSWQVAFFDSDCLMPKSLSVRLRESVTSLWQQSRESVGF